MRGETGQKEYFHLLLLQKCKILSVDAYFVRIKMQGFWGLYTGWVGQLQSSHYVKNVQINSFSVSYFPGFGLNTEISVFTPNMRKFWLEKTPKHLLHKHGNLRKINRPVQLRFDMEKFVLHTYLARNNLTSFSQRPIERTKELFLQ